MAEVTKAAVKKCVISLLGKVNKQPVLWMSIGSEFQTLGATTLNARLAASEQTGSSLHSIIMTPMSLAVFETEIVFSRSYCCMQYDHLLAWYCRLSVHLSLTKCTVAKRYILQQKCLNMNNWIGSAPHKNMILQLSTPYTDLSPQTPHLLNHTHWCHLANTLKP